MNLIIPMAGRGSRLRPHTLTVPKPLLKVAGKPIVQRLAEDLTASLTEPVDHIAFVIGDFGAGVREELMAVAESLGAQGHVVTQDQPLGTAHAILCAAELLDGPTMIAFADTLFKASFDFDTQQDGFVWAQRVEDPSAFGVLKVDEEGVITDFVEKPTEYVSDLAIVGIYYVRDGKALRREIEYLIDNDIKDKGEYQLTNALENMKNKGTVFVPGRVTEWLDCGNKDATVFTNQRYLEYLKERGESLVAESAKITNSVLIEPVYIGENAIITDSVVGPHVSLGDHANVRDSRLSNSIVQQSASVLNAVITNSMIGNFATVTGTPDDLSLGDYNQLRV